MSYKTIRFLTVGAVGLALLLFTVTISKAAFSAAPSQADATMTETVTATETMTAMPSETETASPTETETVAPTETETAVPTMTETTAPTETETSVPTMTETPGPTMTETVVPTGTQTVTATPVATQQCGREEDRESASAEQHENEDNIHPCVKPTQVSEGDKDDHDDDSSDCNVHNWFTEWQSHHAKLDPKATPNATPGTPQQKHARFQPDVNLPTNGGQNQSSNTDPANNHAKNKQGNGNSQGNNNAQGGQEHGHSKGGHGHK